MNNQYPWKTIKPFSICAFVVITLYSCGEKKPFKKEQDPEDAKTEIIALKRQKLTGSLQIPGELIAWQQVDLYAKIASFVKEVKVDVGSEVRKGQLLVTMEAPELNSQLEGAKSRLQAAEAVYQNSRSAYLRVFETSKTPGTISGFDLDQAYAKKKSDSSQLESARSAYREVADTKAYLEIRAPFNGVISVRNAYPGAYVGPNGKGSDVPLLVLQEQHRLRLALSVPESNTNDLSFNSEVSFTVKAIPGKTFKGHIVRMAGSLDDRLRSERLEMDVYNEDKKLLPGMYAEVNLPLPSSDSTFVAPKTAVVTNTLGVYVITVKDGKAKRVLVHTGKDDGAMTELYGDLKNGDSIVKKGNDELRDGMPVKTK